MAKHPTARRVHRQDVDEDVFVSGVLETGVWAKHHTRLLTIGLGVLFFGIAAFAYMRHFNAQAEERATTELSTIRQTVVEGNQPLAMRDLNSFVKKYGRTASADEARLLLAQVYLQANQPKQAIDALRPIADDPGKSGGASAALIMGAAYEAANQPQQAEQTYLKVADKARFGFEKREALDRAASLRISKGNSAGAAELYERALKTLPEKDEERSIYEMRIAEVRAAGAKTGS